MASDHVLLADEATGEYLGSCSDGSFGLHARCDDVDACVWRWADEAHLTNVASGSTVDAHSAGPPPAVGSPAAAEIDAAFGAGASLLVPQLYRLGGLQDEALSAATFAVREAPARLPSTYLAELESKGWTVVDNIMSRPMLSNLFANIASVRADNVEKEARVWASQDARPYSSNDNVIRPSQLGGDGVSFLAKTPVVAQAAMHPISLYLIESYLDVDSLHYCQVPSIGGLRPAEKTGESARVMPGGWVRREQPATS
jgi:hypothetical protein